MLLLDRCLVASVHSSLVDYHCALKVKPVGKAGRMYITSNFICYESWGSTVVPCCFCCDCRPMSMSRLLVGLLM